MRTSTKTQSSTIKPKIKRSKAQCPDFSGLKQDFGTPIELVKSLQALYGKFDLDVAASPLNHKAPIYFTVDDDGLNKEWHGHAFCNPPFSHSEKFIEKAIRERDERGVTTTMVLAGRIGRIYWDAIYGEAAEVLAIRGHISFEGAPNLATFPVVIVRFVPGQRMGKTIIKSGDYQFHRLCGDDSHSVSCAKPSPFEGLGVYVCSNCGAVLTDFHCLLTVDDGDVIDIADDEVIECQRCGKVGSMQVGSVADLKKAA